MSVSWSCLKGAKILDLSQLLPGPHATSMLRDMGADIVKVEPPDGGDSLRTFAPALFETLNRGKRIVTLDLKTSAGRAELLSLVETADALVEGFRPGVMSRFGLDHAELARFNPAIVTCSISGFGQWGPYAARPGHDLNFLALGGYWAIPSAMDEDVSRPRLRVADFAASSYAAFSLAVAIMSARESGMGQHLDVSIHECLTAWTAPFASMMIDRQGAPAAPPAVRAENGLYRTADGRHIALGILENKFWCHFVGAVKAHAPLLADARYATVDGRQRHRTALHELLTRTFAAAPLARWIELLSGADVPLTPVLDASELFADAHLNARRMFTDADDGADIRFPVLFSLSNTSL
ncbi:CaiB/BaiF CoA transferase family protein [Paraburkholderia acidisoli]|uniref:CoA transferase n=1 Tax=Paraburkholderia acidisoli TaxID=2571748 RepID=A0A7Z2GQ29_9BURK|nr:CaiB/BaiF CoA-transferase family protein [Paraburkholderia acidisoli]QGZ65579.1 CoA transferase [Paraburkholderia acidisoli]